MATCCWPAMGGDALARFSSTTNTRIASWTFAFEPEATAQVLSIAPTGDDGAIISGDFTAINGHPTPAGIARISAAGLVDPGWAVVADGLIRTVRVTGAGKLLLAGSFSRIEDSDRGAVAVVAEGSDLIFADHMGDNTCAQ